MLCRHGPLAARFDSIAPHFLADQVLHFAEFFPIQHGAAETARFFADQHFGHRLIVDEQTAVTAVAHGVTRQTDDPLDVVDAGFVGIAEDHHVAALRITDFDHLGVHHRQADAVGELVDQDEVTDLQRRNHRTGRDLEGFDEKRAQYQHDGQHREEGLAILDQQWLLVQRLQRRWIDFPGAPFVVGDRSPTPGCEEQQIAQCQKTADGHGDNQQQREIDRHISYLPSVPRGTPLAGFPRCLLASCASYRPSAFPAACAYGLRRRRNISPERSCATP